jgi:hypothetical protein
MTAFLLSIAMYHVVQIAFPAWYGSSQFDPKQDIIAPPAALGANGTVAVALNAPGGASRLGILRADGTTTYLSMPSLAAVTRQIKVEAPPGFSARVFARDGTPFATIGSCYEAVGGGGCRETVFSWRGGKWHPLVHPQSGDQFALIAADTFDDYVIEDDFSDRSAVGDNAGLPAPGAFWYRAATFTSLSGFEAAAMCGRYVVGTESQAVPNPNPPAPTPKPVTHAIEYSGTVRTVLGPGEARAVNASGAVVGDDGSQPGAYGRPMLWLGGHGILLSGANGSVDAINDAGLILGTANGHIFLSDATDAEHRIYAIDDLLVDKRWHVEREFGIAKSGRILVIARHAGGARQLVLLDP